MSCHTLLAAIVLLLARSGHTTQETKFSYVTVSEMTYTSAVPANKVNPQVDWYRADHLRSTFDNYSGSPKGFCTRPISSASNLKNNEICGEQETPGQVNIIRVQFRVSWKPPTDIESSTKAVKQQVGIRLNFPYCVDAYFGEGANVHSTSAMLSTKKFTPSTKEVVVYGFNCTDTKNGASITMRLPQPAAETPITCPMVEIPLQVGEVSCYTWRPTLPLQNSTSSVGGKNSENSENQQDGSTSKAGPTYAMIAGLTVGILSAMIAGIVFRMKVSKYGLSGNSRVMTRGASGGSSDDMPLVNDVSNLTGITESWTRGTAKPVISRFCDREDVALNDASAAAIFVLHEAVTETLQAEFCEGSEDSTQQDSGAVREIRLAFTDKGDSEILVKKPHRKRVRSQVPASSPESEPSPSPGHINVDRQVSATAATTSHNTTTVEGTASVAVLSDNASNLDSSSTSCDSSATAQCCCGNAVKMKYNRYCKNCYLAIRRFMMTLKSADPIPAQIMLTINPSAEHKHELFYEIFNSHILRKGTFRHKCTAGNFQCTQESVFTLSKTLRCYICHKTHLVRLFPDLAYHLYLGEDTGQRTKRKPDGAEQRPSETVAQRQTLDGRFPAHNEASTALQQQSILSHEATFRPDHEFPSTLPVSSWGRSETIDPTRISFGSAAGTPSMFQHNLPSSHANGMAINLSENSLGWASPMMPTGPMSTSATFYDDVMQVRPHATPPAGLLPPSSAISLAPTSSFPSRLLAPPSSFSSASLLEPSISQSTNASVNSMSLGRDWGESVASSMPVSTHSSWPLEPLI